MIADISPLGRIGPRSISKQSTNQFTIPHGTHHDRLGTFFSNLSWTDRQILALHFAEGLSPWEIHIVLHMSMNDVLCRIMRLRKIAHQSLLDTCRAASTTLKLKSRS